MCAKLVFNLFIANADDDRRSPLDFLVNGKGGRRGNGKRNNGKSKKDDADDQEPCTSAAAKAQESRRTIAKRELKLNLAEGKRGRGKDKNEDSHNQLTLEDLGVLNMETEQLVKFTVAHPNLVNIMVTSGTTNGNF